MTAWDALVVGAGPAGSAAAAVLASRGARVLLVEKDRFPRTKVCGEFLAGEALTSIDRIGARGALEAALPERIEEGSLHLSNGRCISFRLPAPALGISRTVLDALLAERAAGLGASVRFECRVRAIEGSLREGFRVRLLVGGAGEEETDARVVIGAWGRWDALDRSLDRRFLRRARYFGWNRGFEGGAPLLAGRVRLYLYPGGYCGLSRVEGAEVNLAGVVSEAVHRRLNGGWDAVLLHARESNAALDADLTALSPGPRGFLGTVPVIFTAKPPVENGVLMVGDAAGVLDPFSGQGQAAALASGILAADTASEFREGRISAEGLLEEYGRAWRARFFRGFAWSAVLRSLILGTRLGSAAARIAGEPIVRLGIRKLKLEPAQRGSATTSS
ncbi:MAG: FAD-dependent monooxygenase [Acidobacteriota bacterium]|nr:FAD-dependent monooxygenase [Acidobacteriota bacterium]